MKAFNSDMLRITRQLRGLGQTALAKEAGLAQGTVSKIEGGILEPSEDIIAKLAKVLDFPLSIYFEQYQAFGLPVSVHPMYRKNANIAKKAMDQLEAELNLRIFNTGKLIQAVDFLEDLPLPSLDVDSYGGPEAIASLVRKTWLIPNGPLKNLVGYLERAGCLVFFCDFGNEGVSGVTVRPPGTPPYIFIDKNMPADRQRFTLAHELGHIIMHKVPSPDMENEANIFASCLLVPTKDIKPYLTGKLNLAKFAELKLVWRVSMAALLYAADRASALSPSQLRYLRIQMSQLGYKTKEPAELDFKKEEPTVINELFEYYLKDLEYKSSDILKLLHISENDLVHYYGINMDKKPKLEIVD